MSQLATTDADPSSFVDLDVTIWAWVALHRADRRDAGHRPGPTSGGARADDAGGARSSPGSGSRCGISFGVVLAFIWGSQAFGEYISGYLIEKSLSVDNVFVWSMLFTTLAIPLMYQHRVLFWGIFGALSLRAIFIVAGAALLNSFWWLLLVFGVFLVFTGHQGHAPPRRRADPTFDAGTEAPQAVHPGVRASSTDSTS